jgi:hypothetical protein
MKHRASQAIVELMQERDHDLPWLLSALQAAIELELSTIPPYLCAFWSILDSGLPLQHVRSIVIEEMMHMGLMCNLLRGLGQTPKIVSAAPHYPGPLPGGVRPEVTVYLSGMTKTFLADVAMQVEKPEHPLALFRLTEIFTSIGKFYDAVASALTALQPSLTPDGQLTAPIGVSVLSNIAEALAAIERIKQQGEGTEISPFFDGELAHFYKFGEIFHGKRLVETSPGKFAFAGDDVPFPNILPMARVPDGGWPKPLPGEVQQALAQFDSAYRDVLQKLEDAWTSGSQSKLDDAVLAMVVGLSGPALTLMRIPFAGGGNYGPDFII